VRYTRLLEGLEISEVRLSQLEFSGRLDSEYYRPSHIGLEKLIFARDGVPLSTLCDFVIGPFGSAFTVENYTDNQTYRYIRGKDVKPMHLVEGDNVYMPKADFDRLSKYALSAGDILVSVVGTLGNSALIEKKHLPAIFSCKNTALRTRGIDPRYLITYLNCEYGRSLLVRKERGAVQKGLNLDDLKTLCVYVASTSLQQAISEIHISAATENEKAKEHLSKAETTLLHVLGLENWNAPEPLSYIRSSRDAFDAGRLDAEHFQEGHYALREVLTSYRTGYVKLCDLSQKFTNGAEIREYQETGTPYLRIGDLQNLSVDSGSVVFVDPVAAAEVLDKVRLKTGDVLISRSGSLAVSAVVEREWESALISSHLIRLRIVENAFDPYFVAFFLKTLPGRMQIMQWSNGGVQPEISQPSLGQLIVPKVKASVQLDIRRHILEAATARQRSTDLLNAAKRAVEVAIEKNEKAAFDYLEANT